jgi:hypothetical protein
MINNDEINNDEPKVEETLISKRRFDEINNIKHALKNENKLLQNELETLKSEKENLSKEVTNKSLIEAELNDYKTKFESLQKDYSLINIKHETKLQLKDNNVHDLDLTLNLLDFNNLEENSIETQITKLKEAKPFLFKSDSTKEVVDVLKSNPTKETTSENNIHKVISNLARQIKLN